MKEATGSTFMIYVFLIFLAVYITFLAVALNYAKAFRVKNSVIDIIEQNEGMSNDELENINTSGEVISKIENRLKEYKYYVSLSDSYSDDYGNYTCFDRGYCISKESNDLGKEYYGVVTFVQLSIPFIDFNITIPIKGETRVIERING